MWLTQASCLKPVRTAYRHRDYKLPFLQALLFSHMLLPCSKPQWSRRFSLWSVQVVSSTSFSLSDSLNILLEEDVFETGRKGSSNLRPPALQWERARERVRERADGSLCCSFWVGQTPHKFWMSQWRVTRPQITPRKRYCGKIPMIS